MMTSGLVDFISFLIALAGVGLSFGPAAVPVMVGLFFVTLVMS